MKLFRCVWCGQPYTRTPACGCHRKSGAEQVAIVLRRVNAIAEADMLAGRPITGAHHRAIEKVLEETK